MGFSDRKECPHLFKFAAEYIVKAEGCEEEMYMFFADEPDADSLFIKLVEEFERCILSYFAFHWSYAHFMISQVLAGSEAQEPKKKLKEIVMQATREQRFERVTKNLKVARVFTTLVEEMKAIGLVSADDSQCTDVMVPMAHKDRSPVLLFMGGGMGAGKSTALKDILQEPFWAGASANAVVIEADAFKESDVIYRALSSRGHHDMLQTAELVHQSSTDAASSLLVTALNEGRDVIMDGTLSWVPFVVQTITMARNVHRKRYRMGAGYKINDDGTVTENYWEQLDEESEPLDGHTKRRPYRIELVGVVCDAYLAVVRGISNPNPTHESGSVWHDIVMSPSRLNIQKELRQSGMAESQKEVYDNGPVQIPPPPMVHLRINRIAIRGSKFLNMWSLEVEKTRWCGQFGVLWGLTGAQFARISPVCSVADDM
ncbi:hypothetical protein E3N88_11370 [Mikania micrantha]|uniref:Zeta toxin domain-containing protein n=1 Tax=Mikania micrantha TaxID=192012 RepID=A0A5N6PEB4_9ASTR|nr:hypothetical protein E3N88_11370 [Mikania micrantha]